LIQQYTFGMETPRVVTFDQVLEIAELLPPEQRLTLADILKKRGAEMRRQELIESVKEARELQARGELKTMPFEEMLKELRE
jgi:hypothetical protein